MIITDQKSPISSHLIYTKPVQLPLGLTRTKTPQGPEYEPLHLKLIKLVTNATQTTTTEQDRRLSIDIVSYVHSMEYVVDLVRLKGKEVTVRLKFATCEQWLRFGVRRLHVFLPYASLVRSDYRTI